MTSTWRFRPRTYTKQRAIHNASYSRHYAIETIGFSWPCGIAKYQGNFEHQPTASDRLLLMLVFLRENIGNLLRLLDAEVEYRVDGDRAKPLISGRLSLMQQSAVNVGRADRTIVGQDHLNEQRLRQRTYLADPVGDQRR